MNKGVSEISRVRSRTHTRDISRHAPAVLAKSIARRSAPAGIGSLAAYPLFRAEAEILLHALNVGYSRCFRNPLTFALLPALDPASPLEATIRENVYGPTQPDNIGG
jgi:hypothetical protein